MASFFQPSFHLCKFYLNADCFAFCRYTPQLFVDQGANLVRQFLERHAEENAGKSVRRTVVSFDDEQDLFLNLRRKLPVKREKSSDRTYGAEYRVRVSE